VVEGRRLKIRGLWLPPLPSHAVNEIAFALAELPCSWWMSGTAVLAELKFNEGSTKWESFSPISKLGLNRISNLQVLF